MKTILGIIIAIAGGHFGKINLIITLITVFTATFLIQIDYKNMLLKRFGAETNNREYESRIESASKFGSTISVICTIIGFFV